MESSKLKGFLLAIIVLMMRFDEVWEDKNISLREVIGSLDEVKDVVDAFKDFKEALEAYKTLTTDEKIELITYFRVKFDIQSDQAEELIETGFSWMISTEILTGKVKRFLKK